MGWFFVVLFCWFSFLIFLVGGREGLGWFLVFGFFWCGLFCFGGLFAFGFVLVFVGFV